MRKITLAAVAATAAVAAVLPSVAGAHATVSAMQPQGASLTGARQAYVVRAPNETVDLFVARITLLVPEPVQAAISVRPSPGWNVKLTRVPTGAKDEEGNPVMKTTKVEWTAKKGFAYGPGFYDEWDIRFQNPVTPQKICFPIIQYYRGKRVKGKKTKTETVRWTGSEGSETPASCINVVAQA